MSSLGGESVAVGTFLCGLPGGLTPSATLTQRAAHRVISTENQLLGQTTHAGEVQRVEKASFERRLAEASALWAADQRTSGPIPCTLATSPVDGLHTCVAPPPHVCLGWDEDAGNGLIHAEQDLNPGLASLLSCVSSP